MIQGLLYYVVNVYPEGVKLCRLLDTLSQHIMKGRSCNDYQLDSDTLDRLGSYIQTVEKDGDFKEDWVSVETSPVQISTVFS